MLNDKNVGELRGIFMYIVYVCICDSYILYVRVALVCEIIDMQLHHPRVVYVLPTKPLRRGTDKKLHPAVNTNTYISKSLTDSEKKKEF